MSEQRSLTLRIRIDGRTAEQEKRILAQVRRYLASLEGQSRPTLEVASASSEAVAVSAAAGEDEE